MDSMTLTQDNATRCTETPVVTVDSEVAQALAAFWRANRSANAAARVAERMKKNLNAAMLKAGAEEIVAQIECDDGVIDKVRAAIESSTEEVIDVAILQKVVGKNAFMSIVAATKAKVTEVAGTNVLAQCLVTRKKNPALVVKEMK